MRFYSIAITDPASGKTVVPDGFQQITNRFGQATYSSFVNNTTIPGAWNVEVDIPIIGQATPEGGALVKVWGVSIKEISQANDLNGKNIKLFGGFQAGLPLAKPQQAGLLMAGNILQAFGNWIGTDMSLDLVIFPGEATSTEKGGTGRIDAPANIVLNWPAGTPLGPALDSALKTAFKQYNRTIAISSDIVSTNQNVVPFPTLDALASWVRQASLLLVKTSGYKGVTISPPINGTITASDGTSVPKGRKTVAIGFSDLIGQPTWIESPLIQFKTAMRSDISLFDHITLPPTQVTNTANANSFLSNQRVSFQGGFSVTSIRHVGNFRQPSADAWVTVFDAVPTKIASPG